MNVNPALLFVWQTYHLKLSTFWNHCILRLGNATARCKPWPKWIGSCLLGLMTNSLYFLYSLFHRFSTLRWSGVDFPFEYPFGYSAVVHSLNVINPLDLLKFYHCNYFFSFFCNANTTYVRIIFKWKPPYVQIWTRPEWNFTPSRSPWTTNLEESFLPIGSVQETSAF